MSDTIDIVHIKGKLAMPSDRAYLLEIASDGTPTTTGLIKTPQGHTMNANATGIALNCALAAPTTGTHTGNVVTDSVAEKTLNNGISIDGVSCKDSSVTASGGLSVVAANGWGMNATGQLGAATISAGTNVATAPEFEVNAAGKAFATALDIGPNGGPAVASITSLGAISGLSVTTDTIAEKTFGSGVNVDGCLIKDNKAAAALTADACSGNAATATTAAALVASAVKQWPCALLPADHTGAEWTGSTSQPGYVLANLNTKTLWAKVVGLPHGSIISGWEVQGTVVKSGTSTLSVGLYRYANDGTETIVGTLDTAAISAGALNKVQTITPHTMLADHTYALKIIGTADTADSITIPYAEVDAKLVC